MKELIRNYVRKNIRKFNFVSASQIKVDFLARGEYNENYLVEIDKLKFVFRVNLYQQSGLSNQIEYEFRTLRFLEDFGITPRPVFYDDSKRFFKNDIVVYSYVHGRFPGYNKIEVAAIAKTFNLLHSIKVPRSLQFMKRDFVEGDKEFIQDKFEYYEKICNDKESIDFFKGAIKKFFNRKHRLKPTWTIIHTDPVPSNMVYNFHEKKVIVIDWEKARVDDPSYDLCLILSPVMAWNWGKPLNAKLRKCFIENYKGFCYDSELIKKVRFRYPLTVIWFALWTVIRIAEIEKEIVDRAKVSDMERYCNFRDMLLSELRRLRKGNLVI